MKKICLSLCLAWLCNSAVADILGFSVGAQYWHHDLSGQVNSPLSAAQAVHFDLPGDHGFNPYLQLEHPVPFLPNFRLQQNNIQSQGMFALSDPAFMGGQRFMIRGDIDLSHADLILYYELLDNWVNLDLGMSFKYFDGYQRFYADGVIDDAADFDDVIPLVYLKGQFDLPFTGFSAWTAVEALSLNSNHVVDVDLALRYEHSLGFAADLGYRSLDVDLKNLRNYPGDMVADGFYLGVSYNF